MDIGLIHSFIFVFVLVSRSFVDNVAVCAIPLTLLELQIAFIGI